MKNKIVFILKIIGVISVLGSVAYDLLADSVNRTAYWAMLAGGIIVILVARIAGSISADYNDNSNE